MDITIDVDDPQSLWATRTQSDNSTTKGPILPKNQREVAPITEAVSAATLKDRKPLKATDSGVNPALVKEFSGHGPILGETSHPRAPKVQPQRQPTPLASCGSENPYVQRAYQIGPIPCGLGNIHLANHLSPPGWNIGDPLIHPQQAFKLYLFSAGEHLNFPKLGLIKNTHQERACRWKCHLQRVLLYERIEVFERNQIHQHTSHLFNENELEKTAEIQAMQLSELGIPWARDFPKNVIPSAPKTFGGQTASVVEQRSLRIQTDNRQFPAPSAELMSPNLLDPTLLPQTLESVLQTYQARQADLLRQTAENHQFLSSWITRYGPRLSQQQLSPGVLPPLNGPRAKPFFSNHDSFPPSGPHGQSIPRPPPYQPPNRYDYEGTNNPLRGVPQSQTFELTPVNKVQSKVSQGYAVPTFEELSYLSDKETGDKIRTLHCQPEASNENEMQGAGNNTDDKSKSVKKRAAQPKAEKAKPWYSKELAAANLPTSEISQEALQAGLDYDPKKGKGMNTGQPNRRPPKPIIDPSQGFPISARAATVLASKGATDRRPTANIAPLHYTPLMGASAVPSNVVPAAGDLSALSSHPATNLVASRDASPTKIPSSATNSDYGDDPKDGDFGKPTSRGRTPKPRKRKLGASSAPNKRPKPSHDDELDAAGDTDE